MFGCKHLARNPARGEGKEIVVPVLNALDFGQILARVFIRAIIFAPALCSHSLLEV